MKIATVVGARPQFIKAAAISRIIGMQNASGVDEVLIHTGQHHDENMSGVFFNELGIPAPRYNLAIAGGNHGAMTGRMLSAIEEVLLEEKPDWLLIYGDTNSTLAGALAAAKLHIPVAHVEAGLRSFNMRMPEEVNRIVADRLSTLLFCPTATAVNNLTAEGITQGVHNVGDVMYDVSLYYAERAQAMSRILERLKLTHRQYILATCHRAENTDDPNRLREILEALAQLAGHAPVVLPLHPRSRKQIAAIGYQQLLDSLIITEPLAFLDMISLERSAKAILTDSGGVQKEAFFYRVPCFTMRDETEWVETVESGWNQIVGADRNRIVEAVLACGPPVRADASPYGDGHASEAILRELHGRHLAGTGNRTLPPA
ncbi:MAG: UDP-N-acetylglucosamine 2-epimerase (non-hydrolyzing) [Pseudomonadales bacterium]